MFNSLPQSAGGWRGDSTRSHPGSARKITSCSCSWKNTWPQTHGMMLYTEASAPHPGWCHLPWPLRGKGRNHHQPMGSVIDALPGLLQFQRVALMVLRTPKQLSLCLGLGSLRLTPVTGLGLCLSTCAIAHPHHNCFNESEETSTKPLSCTDFMSLAGFALSLRAREIKYSSFCWCQWGLKLKTN